MRRPLWLVLVVFAVSSRRGSHGVAECLRGGPQGLVRRSSPSRRRGPSGGRLRYLIGLGSSNVAFSPDGKADHARRRVTRPHPPPALGDRDGPRPSLTPATRRSRGCGVRRGVLGRWQVVGRRRPSGSSAGRRGGYRAEALRGGPARRSAIRRFLFSSDGKVLAASDGEAPTVWGWEVRTGHMLCRVDIGDESGPSPSGPTGRRWRSGNRRHDLALVEAGPPGRERRRL